MTAFRDAFFSGRHYFKGKGVRRNVMLEWIKKIFIGCDQCEINPRDIGRTRVFIKYDAGVNNHLTIRGNGAGLTWERGVILKNIGPDEWVWESNILFKECEFKVLINDEKYEVGDNHHITGGKLFRYTPHFS